MSNLLLVGIDLFSNLLLVGIDFITVINALRTRDPVYTADYTCDIHEFAAGPMQLDHILTVNIAD
jgi:hypothetical protein